MFPAVFKEIHDVLHNPLIKRYVVVEMLQCSKEPCEVVAIVEITRKTFHLI